MCVFVQFKFLKNWLGMHHDKQWTLIIKRRSHRAKPSVQQLQFYCFSLALVVSRHRRMNQTDAKRPKKATNDSSTFLALSLHVAFFVSALACGPC